jgi:tRNA/tmRNA/rRNA uracil-C5-methylase (TrmA/RlmC/RlmD family)
MRVLIEDRNGDGRGRGRAGERVALVDQAHPGEVVVLRPDRASRGTIQGRVARLLRRDPGRVPHACRHEFHCTGCPLLAAPLAAEDAFKAARVEAGLPPGLRGLGIGRPLRPVGPFGYRCFAKQTFSVRRPGRQVILGSYVHGTRRVVDNSGCPVLVPALAGALDLLARAAEGHPVHGRDGPGLRHVLARWSRAEGRIAAALASSDPGPAFLVRLAEDWMAACPDVKGVLLVHAPAEGDGNLRRGEPIGEVGEPRLRERLLGHDHELDPRAFFQVNPWAAEELFRLACEGAGRGAWAVEGYAGVGALTRLLLERFERVLAVESDPVAGAALLAQAQALGGPLEARIARVESVLLELQGGPRPDALVLDPPRGGLGAPTAGLVAALGARRIILLSCDPLRLGQDLAPIFAAGYAVQGLHLVDLLPRTAHVETATLLVREGLQGEGGGPAGR